jgi:hypothetical protein
MGAGIESAINNLMASSSSLFEVQSVRFGKLRSYLEDSLHDQFSALFCESFSQFVRESVLFLLRVSQGLDALLLKTARAAGGLAVAVENGEGCSVEAMQNANMFIVEIVNALHLLFERTCCKATLRR